MRNAIEHILYYLVVVVLAPVAFVYGLGFITGEAKVRDNMKLLIALVLALVNSAFVWWMIYEVFIK